MAHTDTPTCSNSGLAGAGVPTHNVPFVPLLLGLAAWPVGKLVAEFLVWKLNRPLFEHLQENIRKRYEVYFGAWLGLASKLVSLVACSAALLATPAETDIAFFVRPFNLAEQWCWGCRAVIYIQEIQHYVAIPEMVIHHLLSIAAAAALLHFNLPRRQLYLIWASLLSELLKNARIILRLGGGLTDRISWWISAALAVTMIALRITGNSVAIFWTIRAGGRSAPLALVVYVGCLVFYQVYMIRIALGELRKTGLMVIDTRSRPAAVHFAGGRWSLRISSLLIMGPDEKSISLDGDGGSCGEKECLNSPTSTEFSGDDRQQSGGHGGNAVGREKKKKKSLLTARNIGLFSAGVLMLLLTFSSNPQITSLEGAINHLAEDSAAKEKADEGGQWELGQSWQIAAATAGAALMPVAVMQALG